MRDPDYRAGVPGFGAAVLPAPISTVHRTRPPAGPGRAVALCTGVAFLGLAADLVASGTPGLGLGVGLGLGAFLGALAVPRTAVRAAVVMVPLVYLGLIVVSTVLVPSHASGSYLLDQASNAAVYLITDAPTVAIATLIAFLVVLARRAGGRRTA